MSTPAASLYTLPRVPTTLAGSSGGKRVRSLPVRWHGGHLVGESVRATRRIVSDDFPNIAARRLDCPVAVYPPRYQEVFRPWSARMSVSMREVWDILIDNDIWQDERPRYHPPTRFPSPEPPANSDTPGSPIVDAGDIVRSPGLEEVEDPIEYEYRFERTPSCSPSPCPVSTTGGRQRTEDKGTGDATGAGPSTTNTVKRSPSPGAGQGAVARRVKTRRGQRGIRR